MEWLFMFDFFPAFLPNVHASVWAILSVVVLFGILNLIDFKRLD